MKKLHSKLEVTCKWPAYKRTLAKRVVPEVTFLEYVRLMRQSFEAANGDKVEIGVLMNEHEELQK
jgi:hypothetical protein